LLYFTALIIAIYSGYQVGSSRFQNDYKVYEFDFYIDAFIANVPPDSSRDRFRHALVEKILDQRDYTGRPYRDNISSYRVLPDGWVTISTTLEEFESVITYFQGSFVDD
jgi:hypothetical protein